MTTRTRNPHEFFNGDTDPLAFQLPDEPDLLTATVELGTVQDSNGTPISSTLRGYDLTSTGSGLFPNPQGFLALAAGTPDEMACRDTWIRVTDGTYIATYRAFGPEGRFKITELG